MPSLEYVTTKADADESAPDESPGHIKSAKNLVDYGSRKKDKTSRVIPKYQDHTLHLFMLFLT
jgi:hypothetical protein